MDAFGLTLKRFRMKQGITQEQLADMVGVTRNTVVNWETRKPPNRDVVLQLTEALLLTQDEQDELLSAAGYSPTYQIRKAGRCDYYAHISLPPIYVERTKIVAEARASLLSDVPTIALTSAMQRHRAQALHGMGGIGKTVLARALCDEPAVQAAFPGGILWVTLGRTPELLPVMRSWIAVLGGTVKEYTPTVDSLKNTLARLLKDRACLLILDDVWQRSHAEAFCLEAPRCRLLLTTRDAAIARELGAKVLPIPGMAPAEAMALLEEWAGGSLAGTDPALKSQIVKRLGYLPLAVKLAGAQLQRKPPEAWLRLFDIRKLKSQRPEDIHDDMELTFRLSLEELKEKVRHLYVALAIFKEDEPIPQVAIERLWQALRNLDAEATTDLLDDLAARALLEVIPGRSLRSRSVLLHDLLRDLISAELGDTSVTTHRVLLNAYHTTCKGAGWHTADDDGYLYDHLAYHLSAGGMGDGLKGLFADQRWLQVRVCAPHYLYNGYLGDLMLAWKLAATQARQQIEANQEPGALGDCMRYLLICSSINSLAGNYVPELLLRAVEVGLWSTERALSVAVKIPEATKRAKVYTALLGTRKLRPEQQEDAQRLAVEAAQDIQDDDERARALAALAAQLTGEPRRRTLERGLEAALALSEESQVRALVALAPQLTGELLQRGLEIGVGLDEEWQPEVLAALAAQLTGEPRRRTLERGLETVALLENGWRKAEVLAALAPQLTGELLAQALEIALSITQPGLYQGRALAAVGPYLTGELLERALAAALELSPYGQERARALTALALQLPEGRRRQLLEREVENTVGLWNVKMRMTQVEILATLIPHVTGELLLKALKQGLEDVETMGIEGSPEKALVALAPYLTGDLLERALEAALALHDTWHPEVLAALALRLPEELRHKALARGLEAALRREHERGRAGALADLAPHLTGDLLERALEAAMMMSDEWEQTKALVALAPYLPGESRSEVLAYGIETALARSHMGERAYALAKLAPQLTGELLERALEAVLALDGWEQIAALKVLAPRLTGKLVERALEAALAETIDDWQAEVLAALAPQLTGELHHMAVERGLAQAAGRIDSGDRAKLLVTLAPQLTGELLQRGLEIAAKLSGKRQAEVLAALAPQLTGEPHRNALERGIEAGLSETIAVQRARALAALAPQLSGELLERALEAAQALPGEEEEQVGLELRKVSPRAELLFALAPRLTEELLERCLKAALALPDEWYQAAVLKALAPRLTGELLERALEAALAFSGVWTRAEALEALAPYLMGEQLERALKAALALPKAWARAEALGGFLPRVSDQTLLLRPIREAMIDTMLSITHWPRRAVFQEFFIKNLFTPPILAPETLSAVASHIVEICKEWHWL